jgi:uncharacterized protein YcbK (DUF882 family)
MSMPVTQHFDVSEFQCHDLTPYPAEWIYDRLLPMCRILETTRSACGDRPVSITSGYRSPAHNMFVGGASASQHMQGRAADIEIEGMAPSDVHATILALFNAGKLEGLGGLGVYPSWVHVDIRPWIGHLARWEGTGIGSEQAV